MYYRLRPRRDWNGMKVADKPHRFQGITIDARLTYIEPDGSNFIATVEATSLNKRKEVDYSFNWFRCIGESYCLVVFVVAAILGLLFLWGALDLGTNAGAMPSFWSRVGDILVLLFGNPALSAVYESEVEGFNLLHNRIIANSLWTLTKIFGFCWLLSAAFLLLFPKRYRYIYAIEQFKRFHANDQWVAISHELYNRHDDAKYVELHRQCAFFGFGLMELQPDRNWRILLAPKRGDYFTGLRQQLPAWIQNLEKSSRINKILAPKKTTKESPIAEIDPLSPEVLQLGTEEHEDISETTTAAPIEGKAIAGKPSFKSMRWKYLRRLFLHQIWEIRHFFQPAVIKRRPNFFHLGRYWVAMGLCGSLAILGVIYQHEGVKSIVEVGEKEAVTMPRYLEVDRQNYTPLDPSYEARLNDVNVRADGSRVNEKTTNQRTPPPATPYNLDNRLEIAPEKPEPIGLDPAILGYDSDIFHYRLADGDTTLLFNCMSFANAETIYVLLYEVSDNFEQALGIAWRLHQQSKLVVNISRSDCFSTGAAGYIVFLEDPMTDESMVNFRYRTYTREFGIALEILAR